MINKKASWIDEAEEMRRVVHVAEQLVANLSPSERDQMVQVGGPVHARMAE